MQFIMRAVHGPITDIMPYVRKCDSKAIYGAAKEAMRTFKKYKTHGRLHIDSAGGRLYATVEYAGAGDVKVVYHERSTPGYRATRVDICEIKRQSILASRICPRPTRRNARRPLFAGVRA